MSLGWTGALWSFSARCTTDEELEWGADWWLSAVSKTILAYRIVMVQPHAPLGCLTRTRCAITLVLLKRVSKRPFRNLECSSFINHQRYFTSIFQGLTKQESEKGGINKWNTLLCVSSPDTLTPFHQQLWKLLVRSIQVDCSWGQYVLPESQKEWAL